LGLEKQKSEGRRGDQRQKECRSAEVGAEAGKAKSRGQCVCCGKKEVISQKSSLGEKDQNGRKIKRKKKRSGDGAALTGRHIGYMARKKKSRGSSGNEKKGGKEFPWFKTLQTEVSRSEIDEWNGRILRKKNNSTGEEKEE